MAPLEPTAQPSVEEIMETSLRYAVVGEEATVQIPAVVLPAGWLGIAWVAPLAPHPQTSMIQRENKIKNFFGNMSLLPF
jgi:hypothetical protein